MSTARGPGSVILTQLIALNSQLGFLFFLVLSLRDLECTVLGSSVPWLLSHAGEKLVVLPHVLLLFYTFLSAPSLSLKAAFALFNLFPQMSIGLFSQSP